MPQKKDNSIRGFLSGKKKPILVFLFVIINVAVIAATAVAEFSKPKEAAELSEITLKWWLLVPATICFLVALTVEIRKYVVMMRSMDKGNKLNRQKARTIARRTVLLGKYYDNITPAAIGGQPFQIYYMRKNSGLSKGTSTSIPIFGMISSQIGFLAIAIICFIFGSSAINNSVLVATAWFGLLFYAFWPVLILGATFFPKFTTKCINFVVKILAKVKIIKNTNDAQAKVESEVSEYVKSIKTILRARGLMVKTIFYSICFNGLIAAIPFFVLTAFGGDANFWVCFTTTVAVMAAVCFVPTPGNAGAAEGTFFLVFSGLSTGYVFWAMLAWRFFSYYVYIIIGALIYFFIHLEKKRGKIT